MNHLFLGLPEQEHVHIDPFSRVYQDRQPASSHTRLIPRGGDEQIRVVGAVNMKIMGMAKIHRRRGEKFRRGYVAEFVCAVPEQMSGNHLVTSGRQRRLRTGFPIEQFVQQFDGRFIFRFRLNNFVPTLQQICLCGLFRCHQGG